MSYKHDETLKLELVWYYNFSDCDCGIKSNWNSMVQAACSPGSAFNDPYTSFIMRAVDKRRDIESALWKLPVNLQNCLCSVHGSNHLPHAISAVFGELAGPIISTEAITIEQLEKLCSRKLLGKGTPKDILAMSELRIEAELLKTKSFNEYKRNRNGTKKDQ